MSVGELASTQCNRLGREEREGEEGKRRQSWVAHVQYVYTKYHTK